MNDGLLAGRLILLRVVIVLLTVCGVVPVSFTDTTIDKHSQTIVIFLPTDSEISTLTTRDLSIQQFLAYKIEIEDRIKGELPGVALIMSNAGVIIAPDRTISGARSAYGFGFVIYSPGRATKVIDGVVNTDNFMDEAHNFFNGGPSLPPKPVEVRARAGSAAETSKFGGTWHGRVRQLFARRYSVIMQLRDGPEGTQVGTVEYPEIPCRGVVVLRSIHPKAVVLDERIQSGSCISNGLIVLTTRGQKAGEWRWFDNVGRQRASAMLKHVATVTH